MKNTKKEGRFTAFTYQPERNYFIGVCLEFDLVVEGRTPTEALKNIFMASIGYINVIVKNNLSEDLLNLTPDPEYLEVYSKLLKTRAKTIENMKESKKKKEEKSLEWNKYFSTRDFQYDPKSLKEETCV